MPWLAFPYDLNKINFLKQPLNIDGFPFLTILNKDGTVAVKDATQDVRSKGAEVFQDWIM